MACQSIDTVTLFFQAGSLTPVCSYFAAQAWRIPDEISALARAFLTVDPRVDLLVPARARRRRPASLPRHHASRLRQPL